MATKNKEKIKVFVKENCKIIINGKEERIEKGIQELTKGKAEILIDAGYAEKVKEDEDK